LTHSLMARTCSAPKSVGVASVCGALAVLVMDFMAGFAGDFMGGFMVGFALGFIVAVMVDSPSS
jgi:hypothetical protein